MNPVPFVPNDPNFQFYGRPHSMRCICAARAFSLHLLSSFIRLFSLPGDYSSFHSCSLIDLPLYLPYLNNGSSISIDCAAVDHFLRLLHSSVNIFSFDRHIYL
jgi:hypothetical protein